MPRSGFVFWLWCFALMVQPAIAGPWQRGNGDIFLSYSTEANAANGISSSLYGEYGWSESTTIGFQFDTSNGGNHGAMVWLQHAIGDPAGPDRWTTHLGGGVIWGVDGTYPIAISGISWGRGLDAVPLLRRLPGGGWVSVELRTTVLAAADESLSPLWYPTTDFGMMAYLKPETSYKAGLTLGWNAKPRLSLINQLRLEQSKNAGFSAALASSAVFKLTDKIKIETGIVTPLAGAGEPALRIGTWLEF